MSLLARTPCVTRVRVSVETVRALALDLQLDLFAVVTQRYEPEVQSPGGFLGNDVIIRCNVPAFVKEHVTVTSWLQEPAFNIYPSTVSGE